MTQAISFSRMKWMNRLMVLNLIRQRGPITRAEITERTKLASSAVANVVNELLAKNLVCEKPMEYSGSGRPPLSVVFNPSPACVIGINVAYGEMTAVLTDLGGNILKRTVAATPMSKDNEHVLQAAVQVVRDLQAEAALLHSPVAAVGVGVAGLVDAATGVNRFSPNFQWVDVPVRAWLSRSLNLPVWVDNDVRLATFGEWLYGAGRSIGDFACLFAGTGVGVGVGMVIGGALHYGGNGTAGELGHTVVDPDGPRCSCGRYGCLEAVASGRAISASAVAAIKRGRRTSLAGLPAIPIEKINEKHVVAEACNGDELSREILQRTGHYLGIAIAMLTNIVNPNTVAVNGVVFNAGNLIFDPMLESFNHYAMPHVAEFTKIVPAQLGTNAGALGAAGSVIERLYSVDNSLMPGGILGFIDAATPA